MIKRVADLGLLTAKLSMSQIELKTDKRAMLIGKPLPIERQAATSFTVTTTTLKCQQVHNVDSFIF